MARLTFLSSLLALTSVWHGAYAHVEERQNTDMMLLVPVALDQVSPGHTNEPQLRTWESFFWGSDPQDSIANLTIYYGGKNQMVISEDRISSLLSSVVCSTAFDMITYTFKDAASYQEIVQNWNWVNQMAFRSFILTVTDKGCQATPDGDGRQAYQVNGITWNDGQRQALLKVQAKTFMDVSGASDTTGASGNTMDIVVDNAGLTPGAQQRIRKRLIDKSFQIRLAQDFSNLNLLKQGPVSVDCTKCGTTGALSFRLEYYPRLLSKSTGTATLRTIGVGSTALITISAQGAADPIIKNINLKTIPLPGNIGIAGIVSFGPKLSIGVGAQLNTLNVSGSATFGVTVSIPDSQVKADFIGSTAPQPGGGNFRPRFTPIPPSAKAQANIKGTVGPQLILGIEGTIFSKGASLGVALLAPALITNIQANANTQGGVCNNPNTKAGVNFGVDVGASFDAFAGLQPLANTPNRKNFFTTQTNVYSTCVGLAKRSEATPTGVASPELMR